MCSPPLVEARVPPLLFLLCSFSDALDGALARRWHSEFGSFLDPVADKLLVCSTLSLLSGTLGAAVAIPTACIVSREIAISALREWMAGKGRRGEVAVGVWGKLKTASQMSALLLLLLARPGASPLAMPTSPCHHHSSHDTSLLIT
ncbi:MAG: hypothetical protein SGPRY_011968 [Prymnesium sp.]